VLAWALAAPAAALAAEAKDDRTTRSVRPEAYVLFCEGVALEHQKKYEEAIKRFEKALALDKRSSSILFEIGYCYQNLAKNKKAVEYLKRSIKLNPENGPAHEVLAFTYNALGQRDKALEALEAAARAAIRPRNHESLVRRIAWIYEQQGDRKKAIEWYGYLVECGYRRRVAYLSLGTLQLKEHRYDDALASFREAVRRSSANQALTPGIARAYAQLSEKERNEAIRRHERVAAKATDAATHEVLALAYQAAGRRNDLLRALERAAGFASRRSRTQKLFLAEYYEELGKLGNAIEWRRQVLKTQKEPSAENHVRLAGLYVKNEQMELGAATYRRALAIAPERRELLRRIANCHSQLYQWDKAAAALEEFLQGKKLGAEHAEVLFQLGELRHEAGKKKLAAERKKQAFDLVIKAIRTRDKKYDSHLHVALADLCYADKKPARALGYLVIAQQLDPDNPRMLLGLAEGYKRVQNWAEAAATFRRFLEKDAKSIAAAGALLELAHCQEVEGDIAAARASREKAKNLFLTAAKATDNDKVKAVMHAQLGEVAFRRNQPKEAINHFVEALALNPRQSLLHLFLGECYQVLGDWQRAGAHFKSYLESVEPDEDDARTIYRLGLAQRRAGQREIGRKNKARGIALLTDALDTLEKEKRGTPARKADLLRDLAALYSGEKQHEKALKTMHRAVKLAPSAKRTRYQLLLSSIYDDLKRYDDSGRILLEVYKREPENAMVLNHFGYFYAERGRNLDKAVELVKKALHYEPLNGAYIDSLGWAYFKQGKHKEALELLLRALKYEEDPVIRDHVGDAYHKLGEVKEAREAWRKALELDPDMQGVSEKLDKTKPKEPPKPKKDEDKGGAPKAKQGAGKK